ncbi:extracellular solute-binding protein [Streptomyces sp. NPDC001617]
MYYNKKVLQAAGVDIAWVKDWASLTAALEKVKKAGKKGITFSAIGTEEGSFQFLPWYWGAGAKLTRLDSPQGESALSLWNGWLKKGYAPNSVLNNTQTTSWQEFATGDYAFAENGTWQLANAEKAGFEYGVLPIPGASGGNASAPTGGEFVYTLKVFDIIWIMTKGGPADSSTTFATWSYRLGFGNLLPVFGPGAAVGNLLVVAALVFGLVYFRVQRKQALA